MEFKEGIHEYRWLDQPVQVVKQTPEEELALISLPYKQVADITKFKVAGRKIKAIMNCHYFVMGGSNIYLGRCQSLTADDRTPKPKTGPKPFMDFVILKDGSAVAGDLDSWEYLREEVILGAAPAAVLLHQGKDVELYSPECGYLKVTTPNTQSLLLRCPDGRWALAAVAGRLNLFQCRDFAKAYGCTELAAFDSGGSTQLLAEGKKIVYTGRKIPTCLALLDKVQKKQASPASPAAMIESYKKSSKS